MQLLDSSLQMGWLLGLSWFQEKINRSPLEEERAWVLFRYDLLFESVYWYKLWNIRVVFSARIRFRVAFLGPCLAPIPSLKDRIVQCSGAITPRD